MSTIPRLGYPPHLLPVRPNFLPKQVSLWKVQPDNLQDEYGKLAPRVTKHQEFDPCIDKDRPTTPIAPHVLQNAWFRSALEELAQMCGAFLRATACSTPKSSPVVPRLNIDIHVGDALDFCDALLAAPSTVGSRGDDPATPSLDTEVAPPVAFQQGTLQPLQLRVDVLGELAPPAFDVIKSSNLAEYLGKSCEVRSIKKSVIGKRASTRRRTTTPQYHKGTVAWNLIIYQVVHNMSYLVQESEHTRVVDQIFLGEIISGRW